MIKTKRIIPALLTFVMLLNVVGIAVPQRVKAASKVRYELYDYFLDVQKAQQSGTPVSTSSPWSVELRDVRNNWGETNNRTVIDKYQLNSDNYIFAYSSKEAWGMYPGFSFNTVPDAGGVRLYLNTVSPTNSGWGDSATNGWRINAAYTFTAPQKGSYTLGTADQDKVYAFDDCNNFKQFNLDDKIDFGVKITLNNTAIWPKAGEAAEIRDGFAVFGNKNAAVKQISVPTVSNIVMSAGDKVRVEFTSFTPITAAPWAQRVSGTVAMTYDGAFAYASADEKPLSAEECVLVTSDGNKALKLPQTLNNSSEAVVTNGSRSFGPNKSIGFTVNADSGFGNGLNVKYGQFTVKLAEQNSSISDENGNTADFTFPRATNGKYDIKITHRDILVGAEKAGAAITADVNGREFTADFAGASVFSSGDFRIDNTGSGVTVVLNGSPLKLRPNANIRLDRRTNVIIVDEPMSANAFASNFEDASILRLPEFFFTDQKVINTTTNEEYQIAYRFDVNGDGEINIIDLALAKKCAVGGCETTNAQILALTNAESYAIDAAAIAGMKKRLLTWEEEKPVIRDTLTYAMASGLTTENLLGDRWNRNGKGFSKVTATNHSGVNAKVYKISNHNGNAGMDQVINNPPMGTYLLSGYSKAENITRSDETEYYSYALYANVVFNDGTNKEYYIPFDYGTHDWQYRQNSFTISKPATSLRIAANLHRPANGTAYFDGISLVRGNADTVTFNDLPMAAQTGNTDEPVKTVLETRDGLKMSLSNVGIQDISVGGNSIASNAPSGFLVRDVNNEIHKGVYGFNGLISKNNTYKGQQQELGLSLNANYGVFDDHISVSGIIKDTNNDANGRAVELSYALPVSGNGWHWSEDVLSDTLVQTGSSYNVYKTFNGKDPMSVCDWDSEEHTYYPVSTLYNDNLGIAMAVSLDFPTYWELEYNGSTESYVLTYQLGITNEAPDAARFKFEIYRLDNPEWGFRSAMSKYAQINPDYYEVREKEHGTWLAWEDVSHVPNVEDFNIKFKEYDQDSRPDGIDEYMSGIKGYYYMEAGDWWIPNLRTADSQGIWDKVSEVAAGDINLRATKQAIATEFCFGSDYYGDINHNFVNTAWCPNGAQIHVNANPALPGQFNFYNLWYNPQVRDVLFNTSKMKGSWTFDGIYLDELSGWWMGNANFNKEQYKYTTVPLTYSPFYNEPMLHRASTTWEFVKKLSDEMHASGKTVFANKCPDRNAFYTPLVDIMGTEQTALSGSTYAPQSIEQLSTWRTLAYSKPFCILLSNDYDVFNGEMMEKYFSRCVPYAIFPSPHDNYNHNSRYFRDSAYFERDRELFKKYTPVIKTISEAGWEAVTGVRTTDSDIITERYGSISDDGATYIALYNPTGSERVITVSMDSSILGIGANARTQEMLNNAYIEDKGNNRFNILIPAERSLVVKVTQ